MSERVNGPAGSIYDLGYRRHEGERLGRAYAAQSLFFYSLRGVFGIGRSLLAKLFAFGLAGLASFPAAIQLAIAAIVPLEFEYVSPEDYFSFIQIVLALFCAVVGPEVMGRDQRTKTLPLYFSRALSRADYVTAKVAALALAIFIIVVVPQIILFLGSAVATEDLVEYIKDNAADILPIFAGSALVATFFASVTLAIAIQTSRRAFATGAVLAFFVIFTAIGLTLLNTLSGPAQDYAILLSPIDTLDGAIHFIFGAEPPGGSDLALSDLDGVYFLIAALAYIGVALAWLYRRLGRMAV